MKTRKCAGSIAILKADLARHPSSILIMMKVAFLLDTVRLYSMVACEHYAPRQQRGSTYMLGSEILDWPFFLNLSLLEAQVSKQPS
jgi:hypothetical protein